MDCRDCDRPLATYQGINQRPEDAEVFCEYCESNPPKIGAADHSDFGDKFLQRESQREMFYYVDHSKPWQESPPTYLALHNEDGEISKLFHPTQENNYTRQFTTFSSPRVGYSFNELLARWTADNHWPKITHVGIWDAKESGNLLFHAPLSVSMNVEKGDTFEFLPGSVKIEIP